MTHQTTKRAPQRVGPEEVDEQLVIELPARAALSLVNANLATPICAALALNVASDNSAAIAVAYQHAPVYQHN